MLAQLSSTLSIRSCQKLPLSSSTPTAKSNIFPRVKGSRIGRQARRSQSNAGLKEETFSATPTPKPSYSRPVSSIRSSFLKYFERNGHLIVPSSNIVPVNDPSLLFTSAGMVQFKESFLGLRKPLNNAITTVQKCVRAGGKHNDLDNVGFTARHHTFFEMLGNFSFGAYDKREAINLAWTFLTKEIGLPKERLSVTVLNGDENTRKAWRDIAALPDSLIRECGEEDNFWSMGDVGPCGPCTEIFWDQLEPVDGDRYLEIWNLVFMQNLVSKVVRSDGTTTTQMSELPVPCIDTGMGLERVASVLQGKRENYAIDTLHALLLKTQQVIEHKLGSTLHTELPAVAAALRVIVDHLRSASFLISEGLMPGNQGRAYVLRRIIRRATRYAHSMGVREPILAEIFPLLAETMADAYPELRERSAHITNTLTHEEQSFFGTIHKGMDEITRLLESKDLGASKVLRGDDVFKLYETYGFPVDLTDLIAKERGWSVDLQDFERVITEQRAKDRLTWRGSGDEALPEGIYQWTSVPKFIGYDHLTTSHAEIVEMLQTGPEEAWVSIDPCPFYAESGGQVGDRGILHVADHTFQVIDSIHPYPGGIALRLKLTHNAEQTPLSPEQVRLILQPGAITNAVVDGNWRRAVRRNHTATHLLHAALREVLGCHVVQAGSRVSSESLRFDFAHYDPLSADQLRQVEQWVNKAINDSIGTHTDLMTYDDAVAQKAMALFSEKYDKATKLRVVNVPGVSMELCGGTHVSDTSEIGLFKIVNQTSVGPGVRRVEALTGAAAFEWLSDRSSMVERIADILNARADMNGIPTKVERLYQVRKESLKEIDALKDKIVELQSANLKSPASSTAAASQQSGYKKLSGSHSGKDFLVHVFQGDTAAPLDLKHLRSTGDRLRDEFPAATHAILTDEWLILCAKDVPSKDYLRTLLTEVGVAGGGPPNMVSGSVAKIGITPALEGLKKLAGITQ